MRSLAAALPIAGSLAIAVGLIAVSYGHVYSFVEKAGAKPWEAAILAATVDGAIVVALAVIGLAKARGQEPPKIAKITLVVAVVATGAANLDHGIQYGWRGLAAAVWVPLVAELSYALAMATGQITRSSSVATVAPVVDAHGRPVICGRDVPVAMLAATLVAVRRPAPRDPRPVICGRVVAVATLVATMPPRRRPAVAICGGRLLSVEVVTRPLADLRPVICGHLVAISDVAMPAPLADLRPVICQRPVSVAEVMARTAVAIPAPVATEDPSAPTLRPRPANRPVATTVAAREAAILDWIAEADDPDTRLATATGEDVTALLAEAGHRVSQRTARRDLQNVRDQLATETVAA